MLYSSKRQADKQGVIGDILNYRLAQNLPLHSGYKAHNTLSGGLSALGAYVEPQFNLAGDYLLAVFNSLPPVVKYTCLLQSVAYSPWADIFEHGKHVSPFPKTIRERAFFFPQVPQGQHLLKRLLIAEDKENPSAKVLVLPSGSITRGNKKVLVGRYVFFLDFAQPLKAWNAPDCYDEILYRANSLQDNDFLWRQTGRFCTNACHSSIECLLKRLEFRRKALDLPFTRRQMEIAPAARLIRAPRRFTRCRKYQ